MKFSFVGTGILVAPCVFNYKIENLLDLLEHFCKDMYSDVTRNAFEMYSAHDHSYAKAECINRQS